MFKFKVQANRHYGDLFVTTATISTHCKCVTTSNVSTMIKVFSFFTFHHPVFVKIKVTEYVKRF